MHGGSKMVRFGPFTADLRTGELWRGAERVRIQQQPFRILRALVDRPGQLVSREELIGLLWRDGTFVSFERGLTSALRKVREALGDDAGTHQFIETLPGRGYRFVAPVTFVAESGVTEPPVTCPPRLRAAVRPVYAALAVAVVALAAAGGPSGGSGDRLAAAEALERYACALKAQGRFEEGLAVIQRAHALAPDSARITAEVGMHLHAAKRYDEELPMLLRAVAQDQRDPDAWMHLGLGYARRQDFDAAIPALRRAAALAPTGSRAQYWLDWAMEERGRLSRGNGQSAMGNGQTRG